MFFGFESIECYDAYEAVFKRGDYEPLAKMIEEGNPDILKDEGLREILLKRVRGERWRGSGKRKNQPEENRKRDAWIIAHLYLLKGNGCPIWCEEEKNYLSACHQVSEALPRAGCSAISAGRVHKIWQRDNKKAEIYARLQEDIGVSLREDGIKLTISAEGIKVTEVDKK